MDDFYGLEIFRLTDVFLSRKIYLNSYFGTNICARYFLEMCNDRNVPKSLQLQNIIYKN